MKLSESIVDISTAKILIKNIPRNPMGRKSIANRG
jgi:hypothetical protein